MLNKSFYIVLAGAVMAVSGANAAGTQVQTVQSTERAYTPIETRLSDVTTQVDGIITTTGTQKTDITGLLNNKQNRPGTDCGTDETCLLVKDIRGTEHWYPIITCEGNPFFSNVGQAETVYPGSNVAMGENINGTNSGLCEVLAGTDKACGNNEYVSSYGNGLVYGSFRQVPISNAPDSIVRLPDGIEDVSDGTCVCNVTGYSRRSDDGYSAKQSFNTSLWIVINDGGGCAQYCARGIYATTYGDYYSSISNSCLSPTAFAEASSSAFDALFTVTTTSMSANDTFTFGMSARGTFYVDWGDGTIETLDRESNTMYTDYSHTYTRAGARTIKFGGTATGYASESVISFHNSNNGLGADKVAGVGGRLGALFPTLQNVNAASGQPVFNSTFADCSNLTSIPADLFTGVTGSTNSMFSSTFSGSGLTSVPSGLFSGISGSADYLFSNTFMNAPVTSIPSGLFSNISGIGESMFSGTFAGSNITSIPSGLFSGISGGATTVFQSTFRNCSRLTTVPSNLFSGQLTGGLGMFEETFSGTSALQSIPANLFSGVNSAVGRGKLMFNKTFKGSGLRSIPGTLFSGVNPGVVNTTDYNGFYESTFEDCTHLTALPSNLFSGVTNKANSLFKNTFNGCTALTGYVPASMFSGLIANGSPYSSEGVGMFSGIFTDTQLATSCPSNTTYVETGYEDYWQNKVACQPNS